MGSGLWLALLLGAGAGCTSDTPYSPPAGVTPANSVVVLAMDGLDSGLLERMIAQGLLPNFKRVIGEGLQVDMRVNQPILSPRIWTSVATGYTVEDHKIENWVYPNGHPYRSTDVGADRLWDVASDAGLPVLVAGWLMTTPVDPVNGVMVSDELVIRGSMDAPAERRWGRDPSVIDSWLVWPEDQKERVEAWIPPESWSRAHFLGYQLDEYPPPFHPLQRDETHLRVFESLVGQISPRLSLIYLSGADQVSHLYWHFADPSAVAAMTADPTKLMTARQAMERSMPGKRLLPLADGPTDADALAEGARWVPDYYRYLDESLGRVVARIDPATTTLLVLSDHGFKSGSAMGALIPDHRSPAVFIAWGGATRTGRHNLAKVEAYDVAPTMGAILGLPAALDMRGRVRSDLFTVPDVARVRSRLRTLPDGPKPGHLIENPRREQLEALGYVDGEGKPIPREGAPPPGSVPGQ